MKNIHKRILSSCLLMILFMLSLSTQDTYTFWANSILGSQTNSNGEVTIGSWTFGPYSPDGISYYDESTSYANGDIIWYDGNIWVNHGYTSLNNIPSTANNWTIYNDLNWYSTVTYRLDDLIYYNDNIYLSKWEQTNNDPITTGVNGPWENQVTDTLSWVTGQATNLNEIVFFDGALWIYKGYYTTSEPGSQNDWALVGNLTYSTNYVYANGDFTLYNGTYYTTTNGGWASGSVPGTNAAWTALTVPTFNGSVPNNTKYTLYNGIFYKALVAINGQKRNIQPGTLASKGIWQAINTQQWQQYNTYVNGDLVMYQTNVYELANVTNSSNIPGTTTNSWNGMATINYNALNVYQLGEYTVYNSNVYQVVNATNANNNAPGTIANAWNQISGYQYYWFNVYSAGDIVYYDDAVYIALTQTTNQQPDLAGSSLAWELYQN
ncbi:hypothetical protein [Mariniplasma anaerobium]|uniref:Chitin-binding type-3 domain-containing protein n=1 Tax=Mariniplasma anaerobium TaxID=2735436 RepID=A0A7U9TMC5_9MOLU|nr:hypothetical protein [Mariniplasma anaerobium]BCR36538.1 hypothetical protein MPAN_014310 [Mariniplasma anaerobium]